MVSTVLELLWKQRGVNKRLWSRQFGNDFLKYEWKRISEVAKWHFEIFRKTPVGAQLGEVIYYVLPVKLDSATKAAIADKGEYGYVGLSALKEGMHFFLLMLIPLSKTPPQDYALIRITNATKDILETGKNLQEVIKVEDFEAIEPDYVYSNVEFEKRSVHNFIFENVIDDRNVGAGFQAVISGAPYVINDKGGIALSSFTSFSPFSEEFINTLKLMQPPEYTGLFPSPKLYEGKLIPAERGVKINVAERIVPGATTFQGFNAYSYDTLQQHLLRRTYYKGEYSIACSLTPRGDGTDLLRDIVTNFVKTEVTQPFTLDELKYGLASVDLQKAQRAIDEDLMLQIASQRQIKPSFNQYNPAALKLRRDLATAWQVIIETVGYKKHIEPIYKFLGAASFGNVVRVAQSFARDKGQQSVSEDELNTAWRLFHESSTQLANHPRIQQNIQLIPQQYEDKKFNVIAMELSSNALTVQELFSNVAAYFKDLETLQEYLDKLELAGRVYMPERGKYRWV